ncbi:MAG: TIGR02556 family CRISPR-associated protein [Methanosarcina sp.]
MIEIVKAIGQVVQNGNGNKPDFVELVQKSDYNGAGGLEKYKLVITVDINDTTDAEGNFVSVSTKDFTNNVFREGLSYLDANTFFGAVLRKEKYFGKSEKAESDEAESDEADSDDKVDKNKKSDDKVNENKKKYINKCLGFIEASSDRFDEVKDKLESKIQSIPQNDGFVIIFQRNGQKPIDVYKDKFVVSFKEMLGRVEDAGVCQLCNKHVTTRYETCGYNCYTNDKKIFNKTIRGIPYSICEDCLMDILFGRNYASKHLTTWWGGSNVLFLPSVFNDNVKRIFDSCGFGDNPSESLLKKVHENEGRVFKRMGECNTGISLIFFFSQKAEWKIEYQVNDVASSRFARIADIKHKYRGKWVKKADSDVKKGKSAKKSKPAEEIKVADIIEIKDLSLRTVIYYLFGKINETDAKPDYRKIFASNEARRYLNSILHGYAIDRRSFFSHVMNIYEHNFLQGRKNMSTVHRVYNFLVDCGCLEHGWLMPLYDDGDENMTVYKSTDEFFETNKAFFDSNDKKAWFLLGRLYNAMIWESKKYHAAEKKAAGESTEGKQYHESYLEKNFFFGRKYDWDTFMYFANQCFDLSVKYGVSHKKYIGELDCALKEYIVPVNGKKSTLSPEEAKYVFAWGMRQWFEIDKDKKADETEQKDIEEGDE